MSFRPFSGLYFLKLLRQIFLLYVCVASLAAIAGKHSASVGIGGDNFDGRSYSLGLNYEVSSKGDLLVSFSSAKSLDSSDEVQTTRTINLGYAHKFTSEWKGGLFGTYWGTRDALEARGIKGSLNYAKENWGAALIPHFRSIEFSTADLPARWQRQALVTSMGWGLQFNYTFFKDWSLVGGADSYSYSRDLAVLGNQFASNIFSDTTLNLTSSLITRSAYMEIGYDFVLFYLGAEVFQSVAAVDGSVSRGAALRSSFDLTDSWSMDTLIGASQTTLTTNSQQSDPSAYLNAGFVYFWE
ncbi:MAG: hypothetical protein H6626_06045 [Pseudobdellovibrionaceae bacterium]|nr:hypothetical protein [Bdellovibrionales bacterium]USN48652.1 MAG: hypothetical protein H6626_06045 [Pseudobdellovibrionaceae bacterium]